MDRLSKLKKRYKITALSVIIGGILISGTSLHIDLSKTNLSISEKCRMDGGVWIGKEMNCYKEGKN